MQPCGSDTDHGPCSLPPLKGTDKCRFHTPGMVCGAKKRTGGVCGALPLKGQKRCRIHGGALGRSKAAAVVNLEMADQSLLAWNNITPQDIHPVDALMDLVQWTAGEVDYWRRRVALLREQDIVGMMETRRVEGTDRGQSTDLVESSVATNVAVKMLQDASNRLEKYAASALKAGVDERKVQLAEQQGVLVALVLRRIFDRLDLSTAQEALIGEVVPQELRALTA